ncbi:MAG: hypothetical protein JST09_13685 [Bacteroidetes bacterium]|nr:hypothetical protein [Bacteroidota bacterium]
MGRQNRKIYPHPQIVPALNQKKNYEIEHITIGADLNVAVTLILIC